MVFHGSTLFGVADNLSVYIINLASLRDVGIHPLKPVAGIDVDPERVWVYNSIVEIELYDPLWGRR